MADTNEMVKVLNKYEHGNLTWDEAFKELLSLGVMEYIIREGLGDEPEEV